MIARLNLRPALCLLVLTSFLGCRAPVGEEEAWWSMTRRESPSTSVASPLAGSHSRTDSGEAAGHDPFAAGVTEEPPDRGEWDGFEVNPETAVQILTRAGGQIEFDSEDQPVGLDLREAEITDRLLAAAGQLPLLKWLDLRGTNITDARLSRLNGWQNLELLALNDTSISDAGLRSLRDLPKLRFAALDRTRVSDAGLQAFAAFPSLEAVSLLDTRVTAAGARKFEASKPDCEILTGSEASEPAAAPFEQKLQQQHHETDAPELPPPAAENPFEEQSFEEQPFEEQPFEEQSFEEQSFEERPFGEQSGPRLQPQQQEQEQESFGQGPFNQQPFEPIPAPGEATAQSFPLPPGAQPPLASLPPHAAPAGGAQQLTDVLRRKLDDPEVFEALGHHLLAQRRYREAAQAFAAVVTAQPDRAEAQFQLGVALARTGQYDAALPHFRAVLGEAAAQYNLGVIAYESGDFLTAERHFGWAIESDPRLSDAQEWLERVQEKSSPQQIADAPLEDSDLLKLLNTAMGVRAPAAEQEPPIMEIVPAGGRDHHQPEPWR